MTSKYGEPGWWGGGRAAKAADYCKRVYGWTCWLCGHAIEPGDYSVDHVKERRHYPELTWEPSNWRPAHRTKKPQWNCPGNAGRSAQAQNEPRSTPVQAWTASGW